MRADATRAQPNLLHQAVWVVVCRIVGIVSTLASNLLVARLLGPSGFGIYFVVTIVLALGSLFAMSGLSEVGLRFVSENLGLRRYQRVQAYLNTTLRWACFSTMVGAILVVVALFLFRQITGRAEFSIALVMLMGVGVVLLSWQQIAAQLLRGLNEVRAASFFSGGQTGGPLSNVFFLIPVVAASMYSVSVSITQVVGLLICSVCLTLPLALIELSRARRFLGSTSEASVESLRLTTTEKHEFANVSFSLLGIQTMAFVASQSDVLIIGSALLSPQDLGFYCAAKRGQLVAQMPVQMAMMTIQGSIPNLFVQGRIPELENRLRSTATLAAIPGVMALFLFTMFPADVLSFLFGNSYVGAAGLVLPLVVGLLALIFFGNACEVLAITGHHRLVLLSNSISAVILVVGGALGAYFAGSFGLAVASSFVMIMQNATLWWIAKAKLNIWTHLGPIYLRGTHRTSVAESSLS